MRAWLLLGILLLAPVGRAEDVVVLADFETDADKALEKAPEITIVGENPRCGARALKLVHDGKGYPGVRLEKPDYLKPLTEKFAAFPILALDIYNPQGFAVAMGASAGDANSKDYGSRYNEDRLAAPPGWSTLRLSLTGLLCSNSNNWHERKPLDTGALKFFAIFLHPHNRAQPVTLYFDRLRMESDGLPRVAGLQAFDFGPAVSGIFPGFTGVHEKVLYDAKAGYGWKNPGRHGRVANPDDLGGDFGSGGAFVVKLNTAGPCVVHMVVDTFGEWQTPQLFRERRIAINGNQVFEEKLDGETFLRSRYLRFEPFEDLPGTDLWEERVKPALPVRTFEVETDTEGKLEITAQSDRGPLAIAWLAVYPKAKAAEGQAWLAALDKRRKEVFEGLVYKALPKPNAEPLKPAGDEAARGFAVFAASTQRDLHAAYVPGAAERSASIELAVCPGEREAAQLGFYPFKQVDGIKLAAGDLTGPGGAKIPAAAIELRKVRHFYARRGNSMALVPRILQPFEALNLAAGVTSGVWLTIKVPEAAAPGAYAGELTIASGATKLAVPVRATVHPFTLDPVTDVTISCTGTTAGHWRHWMPDLSERWWRNAEAVIRDQAEHGMNAVTGGPGFRLKAVKDGKAEFDFADADRWLELAARHGLTRRGDSYQGLEANLGFHPSNRPGFLKANDEQAQQKYGIGFEGLLKAAYEEIERHAKEKNWPPRSYALLDEPRPEFGNVQSALEFTKLHTRAAPQVKFTGYYSPGDGREPYFQTMPVSIAHHSEASLKLCVEGGKEGWTYAGGGARHDIGRWFFVAARHGLTGFLRNGYQYVNSDAYYDFSDTEGSWAQTYPGAQGIVATVGWERTAQGVNDFRYLRTLQARIAGARKAGANAAAVQAAEAFLAETLKDIKIHPIDSAALPVEAWAGFRADLAKHIQALAGQ